MQFTTSACAVLGLAAFSSAHMIMTAPVPYGKSTLNNSPLAADGSDFPCKLRGTTFDMEDPSNVMAVGQSQKLAFQGSAVHGGGSCQISIAMLPSGKTLATLSDADAKSLSFKVIHSIQGGCPETGTAGNSPANSAGAVDPSTYDFTIPASVPAGNATLAWTWFNKIGNREMYMNCAPVTITSGTAKRDVAAFSALPDMFKANIGNQCTSQDSMDLVFPDPGDSLVLLGGSTASAALATPTGPGCAAKDVATGGTAATSAPAAGGGSGSGSGTSFTSNGGAFVTTPVPASTPAAPTTPAAISVSPIPTTPVAAATSTAAAAAPAGTGTASAGTGSTSATTPGAACTLEGQFNCVDGTSFQQCASGTWSVVQQVAAGTTCTPGLSMDMKIAAAKRALQSFPRAHLRRHVHGSR